MKTYSDFLLRNTRSFDPANLTDHSGEVCSEAPSNIAIVKYWGKYPGQIPANASLSLSLTHARTITKIAFKLQRNRQEPSLDFTFEGRENPDFKNRISRFLKDLTPYLPWLEKAQLTISSENTFPHSSGIASSASAMAALAKGLVDIDKEFTAQSDNSDNRKKASFIARLGSGSAARSVYPAMAVWGQSESWDGSSDEYAIDAGEYHEVFRNMHDSILIIESGTKPVSSSVGHKLMNNNPFAESRFIQAAMNMKELHAILQTGDIMRFLELAESEALSLHAMMLTSRPGYILMKPGTLSVIEKIRDYRKSSGNPVGFTLDAGANVHVLYPEMLAKEAEGFIDSELKAFCENGRIIKDQMGG